MAGKKEVSKKEEPGLPANLLADLETEGAKREVMSKDDMAIPFLQILQSLSPQCTKGEAEYIKGAVASELFNTVTKERFVTYDDDDNAVTALHVVSIHYKPSYIEWVPRANGGGFVGEYDVAVGSTAITQPNDNKQDIIQKGSPVGTPGNQLSYTHTHYMFVVNKTTGRYRPIVVSMTSTQVKPSKVLNAMVQDAELPSGNPAPRYYPIWAVTTQRRSNEHGTWYVWDFKRDGSITDLGDAASALFTEAKKFAKGVEEGEVAADHAKAAASENPSTDASTGDDLDEEIPF